MNVELTVNGQRQLIDVEADETLWTTLRKLGYGSVKCSCETSNCGACTVLIDHQPSLSCTALSCRMEGRSVETLEGLLNEAKLFGQFLAAEGGDQCGFCNPGFIMGVIGLKRNYPKADEPMIRSYLTGNLCRCTGYGAQIRAVQKFLEAQPC